MPQDLRRAPVASAPRSPFDHPPSPLPVQEGGNKSYGGHPRAPGKGASPPLRQALCTPHAVHEKRSGQGPAAVPQDLCPAPVASVPGSPFDHPPSLVSRTWLDTRSVIPAKAGIQVTLLWIPAYAGWRVWGLDSGLRRNDGRGVWIPASAGMTGVGKRCHTLRRCKAIYETLH